MKARKYIYTPMTRSEVYPASNIPVSGTINFSYDGPSRMTNMVDGLGTTKYTYSAAGQLVTEDGPFTSDTVTNELRTKVNRP